MDTASFAFTTLFCALLVLGLVIRTVLASRQIRHVARHRGTVPAAFSDTISVAAHQKAADYTITKTRFGLLEIAIDAALLLGWTLLGGLDWLNQTLLAALGGGMVQQLALLGSFAIIGGLITLPLGWYATFRIEERFGFNKMTTSLWLGDLLKGTLVGALVGLPIVALVLWLMGAAGPAWWLWAWGAWMVFNLLALVLYPTVIAPLFNKFEPLSDESRADRPEPKVPAFGPYFELCQDEAVGEFAHPERRHRREHDAPRIAEHELVGILPRPARRGRQLHDHPRHECHEGERGEPRPDHPPCAGVAVHFGQDVADDVADRKEQHARTERPLRTAGQGHVARLGRTDYVGQQQDGDEGRHDEVVIAEVPRGRGISFDRGYRFAHARRIIAICAPRKARYARPERARSSTG